MQNYRKEEFVRTGNEMYFGDRFDNYWAVELLHIERGTRADVLLDGEGMPVQSANVITDRMREAFTIAGNGAKIVPISIDGNKCLIIKMPPVE